MAMLRGVVRYMVGTAFFEVKMANPKDKSPKRAHLKVFCDSDWAGQPGRNSKTSVHVEIDGCSMYGYSKRQEAIALSCAESEYYALTSGLSLGLYCKIVLEFMDFAVVLGLENPAGLGTKELAGPKLKQLCGLIGLGS